MIKDRLRREREEQRERELNEMEGELEQDWKELRKERKRAKLGTTKPTKLDEMIEDDCIEFDL